MRRILKIFTIVVILIVMSPVAMYNDVKAQAVSVSFQLFYDELSPYGRWISYPRYGYVWCPNEMYVNFHPYQSEGHWVWTEEYGWMWISDYEWGWATFHYGRWLHDTYYGWIWVPDYEWAPAWVVWRSGGEYYGWAPMSPGINISLYFGSYTPPYNYWCFAQRQYITSPHVANYVESIRQNTIIINKTTVINNYDRRGNVFVTGPSRTEADRYANTKIVPMYVRESGDPGRTRLRKNEVSIYKPDIRKGNASSVVPKKFERYSGDNRNDISIERNRTNPDINRGHEKIPDIKRNENERILEQNNLKVNERKRDNYQINPGRNNPNDHAQRMDRDIERKQIQEMRRIPQTQNNPEMNRYEIRKQQQQQRAYPDQRNIRQMPEAQQHGQGNSHGGREKKNGKD